MNEDGAQILVVDDYDLVLLDIMMPGMNGMYSDKLKKKKSGPTIYLG